MQSRDFNTKAVVEAGLLSAIIVVLMLITAYIPFLSILNVLLPVPVTILYLRHNYKVAISAIVVSGIIVSTLYSPILALGIIVTYSLTGMTLGYCIKRDMKLSHIIMLLVLSGAVAYILNMLLFVFLIQPNGFQGIAVTINKAIEGLNSTIDQAKEIAKATGMSAKQVATLDQVPKLTVANIMLMLPGTFVVASIIVACINYSIVKAILKKLRYKVRDFKPFSQFYIKNKIAAVGIILFCIALLLQSRNMAIGVYTTSFLTIILRTAFLVNGLALVTFYLRGKFKLRKGVVILILAFATLQFENIFFMWGLIDVIMDFRRLDAERLFKR
jgi:uncharacterized protein YybS (DUF2232 family)